MKIFNSIAEFYCPKKTIVTLGTFDGVHIGHKTILKKLTQNIESENCESLVLTFFPHPRMILDKTHSLKLLTTVEERMDLLEKAGVENLVIHPFDKKFSQLTAEEFVRTVLVKQFQVQKIIIGYDHQFGQNRTATITDLIAFGLKYKFEVEQIAAQEIKAIAISSTKIRMALENGAVELANSYLGYPYHFTGNVIEGKKLGRTLLFPTANLKLKEDYKLLPKNGVYVVSAKIGTKTLSGMMNIGYNPTVDGINHTIEVHLFDFDDTIYNQQMQVFVLHRIRDEQKFESLALLKAQLEKDKATALHYLRKS